MNHNNLSLIINFRKKNAHFRNFSNNCLFHKENVNFGTTPAGQVLELRVQNGKITSKYTLKK